MGTILPRQRWSYHHFFQTALIFVQEQIVSVPVFIPNEEPTNVSPPVLEEPVIPGDQAVLATVLTGPGDLRDRDGDPNKSRDNPWDNSLAVMTQVMGTDSSLDEFVQTNTVKDTIAVKDTIRRKNI